MKKAAAVLIIFATIFGSTPVASAEDKISFWAPTFLTDDKEKVFTVGGGDLGFGFSQLGHWPDMICKSTQDPKCDFSRTKFDNRFKNITGSSMLEVCSSAESNDCIESVEISHDGTTFRELTFERYVPSESISVEDGGIFPPDAKMNLPRGGMPSIWVETVDGKVSDFKYLVYYKYEMIYDIKTNRFYLGNVSLAATPFKEKSGFVWASLWTTQTQSGIPYDFRPETSLQITVHISKDLAGWFKARMSNVDVQLLPLNKNNNRLIVRGSTVTTPNFAVVKRTGEMTPKEEKFLDYGMYRGAVGSDPDQPQIFEYVDYWRGYLKDVAPQSTTSWSIESTTWSSNNRCLRDSTKVLGVVATNAMGYEGNAPKFINGFLDYRVTGIHFGADGVTPNLGTYDLIMRSEAARCLYGFSNAPVSAVVSISGAAGASNIATTVVSEKDGWLKMKAAGFTFSEKTLKVKITQKKNLKYSISCVKGKVNKTITGSNPKCPSGYKLK